MGQNLTRDPSTLHEQGDLFGGFEQGCIRREEAFAFSSPGR